MTNTPPTLGDHIAGWNPEPTVETDRLDPAQATRLARTLDLPDTFADGDALPLPWHWIYFSEWPATAALGADGHPAEGHSLPPIPDRRRMFAGSRMTSTAPLRLGVRTEKRSAITNIAEKHGRTGDLLFVTVTTTYVQDGTTLLSEEQDLVYRSDSGHTTTFERPAAELAPATAAWTAEPAPAPPTLFRYSALTSNSHRIHYDLPYASEVEGYPDLVVHGPLLATYLAELARANNGGTSLRTFSFRLQRPLFAGDRFRVEGAPGDDGIVTLQVITGDGTVHVSGKGEF
ncbi:hypothetical protein GYA93_06300 [Gordonia desulfuricans]|uniref:FAS1-like dehydratase domain-containing protein n=1 Tax=Gordonia desulfuricans TaxID=89051 RepID=A0A7K3LLR5_9ACTN|nr:MaoC family dehydratase N-terminal domain-containing protein [Gordonia desulfuricans]NDK89195.1 hypothetical protein [Gordonia desulfuricans]